MLEMATYYPVGLIEATPEAVKRLKSMIPNHSKLLNDEFTIESPVFVEVEVNASGWGDYGPYVHGRVVSVVAEAGIKDCIGVEEIEMITGMDGNDGEEQADEVFDIENPIVRWMCIVWILAIAIITIILLTPIWLMSKGYRGWTAYG